MDKRCFIFIMIALVVTIILSIQSVSAYDFGFNNVKDYDANTKTVTIYDEYIIFEKQIATITLNTPHTNYVIYGKDRLVAEFTIDNVMGDYSAPFEKIMLYDKNDGNKEFSKPITIKEKVPYEVDVADYKQECSDKLELNGTTSTTCIQKEDGSHKETRYEWKEFDSSNLPKGKITIGLFADVEKGETTEFVPEWFKIQMPEFAVWTDSLNVKLVSYLNFDNDAPSNSTFTQDVYQGYSNGTTISNAVNGSSGILGQSYLYDGTDDTISLTPRHEFLPDKDTLNWSINIWVKPDASVTNGAVIINDGALGRLHLWLGAGDTNAGDEYEIVYCNNKLNVAYTILNSGITRTTGNWEMITVTQNSTAMAIYVNRVLKNVGVLFQPTSWDLNVTQLGEGLMTGWANVDWKGNIDEFGVWNRTLTATEISDLYNGGAGISYELAYPPSYWINATLKNVINSTSKTIYFGANLTGVNSNITNSTLMIWNGGETRVSNTTINAGNNASIFVNETYIFTNDGTYSFNFYACGSNTTDGSSFNCSSATYNNTFTIDTTLPVVNFTAPSDAEGNLTVNTISINVSITDANIDIITINISNSTWSNASYSTRGDVSYLLNYTNLGQGYYYINAIGNDTFGHWNNTGIRTIMIDTVYPQINFTFPTLLNGNYSRLSIPVNVTATDTNIKNVTIYLYDSTSLQERYDDITPNNVNAYYNFTTTISDGVWFINATACDYFNHCNSTTDTRIIGIDTTAPYVKIVYPLTNGVYLDNTVTVLNFTVIEPHNDTCKYSIDNWATNTTTNSNVTTLSNNVFGQMTWFLWCNDTFGYYNYTNASFYSFNYTHFADKTSIGGGGNVKFNLTLIGADINSYYANSNASLEYQGIIYYPDTTIRTAQNYTYFERTLTIPSGTGNSTGKITQFNWTYNIKNASDDAVYTGTTDTKNLTVWNITIDDCNDFTGRVILNMSLKDEGETTFLSENISNLTVIELDLDITSRTNSSQIWNFHKKWDHNISVAVCVPDGLLNDTSYKIDFTAGYHSIDHVQEFYYMDNGTLDNTDNFNSYTDNTIDLMDLLTADSTTFLFSFTDEDGLEVDDAIIHTFRDYIGEGLFREVERSRQDNNGETHAHFVEEDVIYYFMVTQYGHIIYTSSQYNAKCLSTPCAISLSASPDETNWSIIDNEGGKYAITTDKTTRVSTLTFSLDESALVNFTIYSYNGANATFINGTSLNAMTGSMSLHVPLVYGNNTFFGVVYNSNSFVKSAWIDLTEGARDYFGTFGMILGGLIVLTMMLMSVSEGAGFIIFTILALIVVVIMQLVDLGWMALVSIVVAGFIIVWKLVNRRSKTG